MSRYPDMPRPAAPYPFRVNRPFVSGGPDWTMQGRALTRFGLLECDLNYRGKSWAEISVLQAFYESVNGAAGRFTFVDFNGIGPIGGSDPGVPWKDLFVVQGDGAADGPWDMPTYGIQQSMTTVAATATSGSPILITPDSMAGIKDGVTLTIANADGTNSEVITASLVSTTSFQATLTSNKAVNWLINPPQVYENGVAKITEWNTTTPAAGHYGVKAGTGTDGLDSLYAGTAPGNGVIVTVSAMCRRAMRSARFVNAKRGFVYGVPENYQGDVVTIAEVRT